ncbi:MAG: hypothetical protein K2I20_04250 [Clostridia bacterium]|nr:hypothetical protein [Clostridia bacterium]MDE7214391.1 hypothetical protein [Clostridia bacterium]
MEQKIIETKQNWIWYFIHQYLDLLDKITAAHSDEGFSKKLRELQSYIQEKIDVDGEITDYFITVLHTAED